MRCDLAKAYASSAKTSQVRHQGVAFRQQLTNSTLETGASLGRNFSNSFDQNGRAGAVSACCRVNALARVACTALARIACTALARIACTALARVACTALARITCTGLASGNAA